MIDPELEVIDNMLQDSINVGDRGADIAYISVSGLLIFIGGGPDGTLVRYRLERLDP